MRTESEIKVIMEKTKKKIGTDEEGASVIIYGILSWVVGEVSCEDRGWLELL